MNQRILFALGVYSFLTICCMNSAPRVNAQDVLEELYGNGVHAYFAGNVFSAQESFKQAVDAGSQDPRVHYFRGLAAIRAQGGDLSVGAADFEQGAKLEVLGKRTSDIARALQRVQGPARLAIEKARTKARLNSKSAQSQSMKQRFDAAAAANSDPAEDPSSTGAAGTPATTPRNDPFQAGGLTQGEPSEMPDAAEDTLPSAETNNPFADDPTTEPDATETPADPFDASEGVKESADADPFAN